MATQNQSDTFEVGDETVHRLGFGAMRLTGEHIIGDPDDREAAASVLQRTVELGVDLIDTADSYGPGVSETLIGQTLGDTDDAMVATKGGLLRSRDGDWIKHGDPAYLEDAVLSSLDRLRTDEIDLYQYHRPDPDVPFEDSVSKLAELKDAGLIRHVGLSNVSVEQLSTARDIVDVVTVQNRFNLDDRSSADVLAACEDAGVGFIPWGPIHLGDGEAAQVAEEVAEAHDATPHQVAIAWLLERSPVMLPIPGTSSVDHLEANVAATALDLEDDEIARLTDADE